MRDLPLAALLPILLAACTERVVVVEDIPTEHPTEIELCEAYRDPSFPCLSDDGASLEEGACCVEGGYLGTCTWTGLDGGAVVPPRCNVLR